MKISDRKKEIELEEARKAGIAPPELDDEGHMINPHIPKYVAEAPWYISKGKPGLKHQKDTREKPKGLGLNEWYLKGARKGPAAKKYRKGACKNCGAMTHDSKNCMERPRKVGAKFTNKNIAQDEVIEQLDMNWEAKHDRWNGFDPRTYDKVIERFNKVEEERSRMRMEQVEKDLLEGKKQPKGQIESDSESEDGEDGLKAADAEDVAQVGLKKDRIVQTTVRNLRIREDTAKYLLNLDANSAHYDPKSRSMRGNPLPDVEESAFKGDNVARQTGEVGQFNEVEKYAWDAERRGLDVHVQAAPSQAELLHRQFQERRNKLQGKVKESVLQKYGGEEYLEKRPPEQKPAATEAYVEYARSGEVLKGREKAIAKSKYEEDVFINNHTSVWGSYWVGGQWGYACCHQTVKNAYCTGKAGKAAVESVRKEMASALAGEGRKNDPWAKERKEKAEKAPKKKGKVTWEKALEKEEARDTESEERKRGYHSLKEEDTEVNEVQHEAWQYKRARAGDPMNDPNFGGM